MKREDHLGATSLIYSLQAKPRPDHQYQVAYPRNMVLAYAVFMYEKQKLKKTAVLKLTASIDIASCSVVELDCHFRGAYCLHHQGNDEDSKHLSNIGQLLQDYTVQYPRRL
jgi:hypothetical protein